MTFRGSPHLVPDSIVAACRERALQGFFPLPLLLRLRPVLFRCGTMAGLTTSLPHVVWAGHRPCLRQSSVLADRERAVLRPDAVGAGSMPRWVFCAAVVCHCVLLWARRLCHPQPAHRPVVAAVGSLRPGCLVGGGGSSPPLPCPSSLGPSSLALVPPGVLYLRGNFAIPGVSVLCGNSTPLPTLWQDPVGFPPLWRPCGPPPRFPLQGTRGPLQRPRAPHRRPILQRFHCPYCPAGPPLAPFAMALPHGSPALPPCKRPQRGLSRCCPRWPALPHVALPRRFLACPTALPSASPFPPNHG